MCLNGELTAMFFLGDTRWWRELVLGGGDARIPFPLFSFASLSRGRAPPGASSGPRAAGGQQRALWRRAGRPDQSRCGRRRCALAERPSLISPFIS